MNKTYFRRDAAAALPPEKRNVFELMRRLRDMPDAEYLQNLVAYHAAPTLEGIKPATLICPGARDRNLPAALRECAPRLAAAFGVEMADLRNRSGALLLMIYQPALLRSVLAMGEVAKLLSESGYDVPAASIADLLARLGRRCASRRFPHEIGVFLGYPPRDVRRFMRGDCSSPVRVGCWKAWGDACEADRRFARYRDAKERAAEMIVGGASLGEMAAGLRIGA